MKIRSMVAFAGTLFITGSLAQAAYTDITIFDGLTGNNFTGTDSRLNGSVQEFGEVEVGNVTHSSWDLRAFGYDFGANKLAYQGGFDPRVELDTYGIGSIFIKLGGAAPPIYLNNQGSSDQIIKNSFTDPGPGTSTTPFFNYAITLTGSAGGSLNYSIYALTALSELEMPHFTANSEAGPYKYYGGGVLVPNSSGSSSVTQLSSAAVDLKGGNSPTGIQGFGVNDNWFAELDLSSISGQFTPGTTFHLTQECGNDSMVGRLDIPQGTSSIPEPGNMVGLMGLLVGSAFLRFRRRA